MKRLIGAVLLLLVCFCSLAAPSAQQAPAPSAPAAAPASPVASPETAPAPDPHAVADVEEMLRLVRAYQDAVSAQCQTLPGAQKLRALQREYTVKIEKRLAAQNLTVDWAQYKLVPKPAK